MRQQRHATFVQHGFFLWILAFSAFMMRPEGVRADWVDDEKAVHDQKDYDGTRKVLDANKTGNENNVEWLWRMARSEYDLGNKFPESDKKHQTRMYGGLDYAKKALSANEKSSDAHSWYAILIGKVGLIEGTEQTIKNSYEVKKHALRAIELNPKDENNYHLMGRWHYTLAELSWIERQIASLIYAKPPQASFQESIDFFKKARDLDPEDVLHYLWLAKAQIANKQSSDAKATLNKAVGLKARDDAEKRYNKEAKDLLTGLK